MFRINLKKEEEICYEAYTHTHTHASSEKVEEVNRMNFSRRGEGKSGSGKKGWRVSRN